MKIGCRVDLNDKGAILSVKDAGADFIEGSLVKLYRMPGGEVKELLHLLRMCDLPLLSFYEPLPNEILVTGEWVDYQKLSGYLPDAMEKASYFCPEVLLWRRCDYLQECRIPHEHIANQLFYLLQKHILPICRKYGIGCAVEPMEEGSVPKGVGLLLPDALGISANLLPAHLQLSTEDAKIGLQAAKQCGYEGNITLVARDIADLTAALHEIRK